MDICPFIYSRPVRPEECANRASELQRLFSRLLSDQSTAIIGPPKSGKTSLLNYVLDQERRRQIAGDRLDRCLFMYLDAQMLSSQFAQRDFWRQALEPLVAQFPSGTIHDAYALCAANNFGSFTLEQLFRAVGQADWRFVLMLDEFDALLTHAVLHRAEFYGSLRSLTSRCKGFILMIASRRSLGLLNEDTQRMNPHGSPYFNVFIELRLGPLPKNHAQRLLTQSGAQFDPQDREFLLHVSGRHPYLLQLAAAALWELKREPPETGNLYAAVVEKIAEQTEHHFTDLWTSRSGVEKKLVTTIALTQLQGLAGSQSQSWNELLGDIAENYAAEIRALKQDGLLVETGEQTWQVAPPVFVWWLAAEIKRHTRQSSEFEAWLCEHGLEHVWNKDECTQVTQTAETVSRSLTELSAGQLYRLSHSTLPAQLQQQMVEFLVALPNMDDRNAQRALIASAVLEAELQQQIELTGPPRQFFQLLLATLSRYGTLADGRNAVLAVLEAAKLLVGKDRQTVCDELIRKLNLLK